MKINCIIIEDEPLAQERLKDYVIKAGFLQLTGIFDSGIEAISFLRTAKVDLIFLDIQMDGFTGIQLLESLTQRPEVIISTAFDQYALKGFELNVADYLLKPYTFERFLQAVNRVFDKISQDERVNLRNFLFVKTEYRLEKVLLDDILFIEGMRDYRRIHTPAKGVMTLQTFKDLEQELPPARFCRVHKSYLVAIDKIESIERDRIKIRDKYIPVSETFKEEFLKRIFA
ncbi:LytR/AlgR family response regulator transcription factor [Pararcticibacter amylolyticus]|uniref:DNA-binding response regulator n=1 Tax=Pararcticibacter amylolyticus TaxID=2173175 RepID=A0A2U2PK11_9SPHI|nr:LytTR family DNA-binding domain-containing protein [Pararcticibacter amylolyticus]PWG81489.1 DNA-binding response regulator [Pararcticibacter amylolyticus]